MNFPITRQTERFLNEHDGLGRYQAIALEMLDVDLVTLARSYQGELVRGSSQRNLTIRQSRRGQLSTEAHGEIS